MQEFAGNTVRKKKAECNRIDTTNSVRSTRDITYEHMEMSRCISRICCNDGVEVLSRNRIKKVSR